VTTLIDMNIKHNSGPYIKKYMCTYTLQTK